MYTNVIREMTLRRLYVRCLRPRTEELGSRGSNSCFRTIEAPSSHFAVINSKPKPFFPMHPPIPIPNPPRNLPNRSLAHRTSINPRNRHHTPSSRTHKALITPPRHFHRRTSHRTSTPSLLATEKNALARHTLQHAPISSKHHPLLNKHNIKPRPLSNTQIPIR